MYKKIPKATTFKKINYAVSSQNKYTFKIPVIKEFVYKHLDLENDRILNLFAGENPIKCEKCYNNDLYLSEKVPGIQEGVDALMLLEWLTDESLDVIVFDPPYANPTTIKKLYGVDTTMNEFNKWISDLKKEIARVLKVGGKVISVGYETNGIGALKGFEKDELLVVALGGLLRDTFVYTEIKKENGLHYRTWKNRKEYK